MQCGTCVMRQKPTRSSLTTVSSSSSFPLSQGWKYLKPCDRNKITFRKWLECVHKAHTNLQRSKESQVTQEELQLPLLLPLSLLTREEEAIDARGLNQPLPVVYHSNPCSILAPPNKHHKYQ